MDTLFWIIQSVLYFEIAAALVGLWYFHKNPKKTPKLLVIYIILVPLIELLGTLLRAYDLDNRWIYNAFKVVELIVLIALFRGEIRNVFKIKILNLSLILCLITIAINGLFFSFPPFREFLIYGYCISHLCIALAAFFYLTDIVQTEHVLSLQSNLMFWCCLGMLVYFICSVPVMVMMNIELLEGNYSLLVMNAMFSIAMYTCFIIGFIWSKPMSIS